MKRKATATWKGTGAKGKGTLSGPSGVLDNTPYSFSSRFENEDGKKGTNPEELIAAAHAGCFAMALSFAIQNAGHEAKQLDVTATVSLDKSDDGFEVSNIKLNLHGIVPDMSEDQFKELAQGAKEGCPISKALSAVPIELEMSFEQA